MDYAVAQQKAKKAKVKEVEDLMRQLVDATNTMGMEEEVAQGIFNALSQSHRTLQNSFMRSFQKAMGPYSGIRADARNEGAVALAGKISELEANIPFI